MKNILKEIKNDIISMGDEPRVDNIEQYISQNKIFSILFYSKIIPNYLNILSSLDNFFNNDNSLKLILCICEDDEEDYNKIFSEINISCLIFNYDSKNKDLLIKQYNIISLPTLIILDKEGKLIDSLNNERITNLNENDIIGWKNKFIVPNIYKSKLPELGDKARVTSHHHELVFSTNIMKGYGKNGWICDVCRKNFDYTIPNFFCALCGWDICDACFDKYKCD